MSLKKKIALSFIISAGIIAILAAFEYVNVVKIKNEIRFLELTDTVRTKTLQVRRHEKNFFLYSPAKSREESEALHRYLDELEASLADPVPVARMDALRTIRSLAAQYRQGFDSIEAQLADLVHGLRTIKGSYRQHRPFFPLLESAFSERPLQAADFLADVLHLPAGHEILIGLRKLDREIGELSVNRGVREESWFVVRKAKMPSILIELGFVTNAEEAALLAQEQYLQKLARAIYTGVRRFVNAFEKTKGFTE